MDKPAKLAPYAVSRTLFRVIQANIRSSTMSRSPSGPYPANNRPIHVEIMPHQISDQMPAQLSQMLYAARWLGMFLVLGVHATAIFINFNGLTPQTTSLFISSWGIFVSYAFGRQAVIGFFVMSGFLVGGYVLARLNTPNPFLRDYFIHRVVRIYMVVIPAIVLTFLFDAIGRMIFPPDYGGYPIFEAHYEPRFILTNLLNLQGVIAPHYGSNGPLWSVGYEFWYYITFPLLLAPLISSVEKRRARSYAALAAFFCVIISLRQIWFPFGFALWALGALITLSDRPFISSARRAFGLFLLTGFILGLAINKDVVLAHPWTQYVADTGTAIAFANLILTMRFAGPIDWRLLDWPGHKTLADFSFTLYAIHNPTLMLLRSTTTAVLGTDWIAGAASPIQWEALATAMTVTIGLAFSLSQVSEGKVGAARRWVKSTLLRFWPDPAASASVSRN